MKFIHGDKISNFIGFGLMLGLENQTETPWSGSSCGNKLNTWIIIVRNKLYESSRRKPGWRFTAGFEFGGQIFQVCDILNIQNIWDSFLILVYGILIWIYKGRAPDLWFLILLSMLQNPT